MTPPPTITKKEHLEIALLTILITLLSAHHTNNTLLTKIAAAQALIALLAPRLYHPLAWIWYHLTAILNRIGPAIILGVVFLIVVTPVAWLRRLSGRDNLKILTFKKTATSVMNVRDHVYTAKDFQKGF